MTGGWRGAPHVEFTCVGFSWASTFCDLPQIPAHGMIRRAGGGGWRILGVGAVPFAFSSAKGTVRSLLFAYDGNDLAEEASTSGTTILCSSSPEPASRGQPLHHLGKRGHRESPSRSTRLHFSNSSWSPNAIIRQPEGGSQWPLVWRA